MLCVTPISELLGRLHDCIDKNKRLEKHLASKQLTLNELLEVDLFVFVRLELFLNPLDGFFKVLRLARFNDIARLH